MNPQEHADLIARVEDLLRRFGTPGATIAVGIDGVFWSASAGSSDLAGTHPLAADAHFPIYSITKTFIATAILKLVESGTLALDLPIRAALPEIDLDPAITIRQILNHTAGLPDYGALPAYKDALRRDPASPWDVRTYLEHARAQGMQFAPGQGWRYSNIGYLILNRLLEYALWTSFGDALTQLTIAPAGLTRTSVATSLADMLSLTPGFSTALEHDGVPRDIAGRYHPGWVSHGLIVSTALETARFIDQLFGGALLAPASLAAMRDPIRVPMDEPHPLFVTPSYGLGLMIDPDAPHGVIAGHAGGGPGYALGALHLTAKDGRSITSVAFANSDRGEIGLEIAWSLLDAVAAPCTTASWSSPTAAKH